KDQSVNDWLNHRMDRTEFMPFAPVSMDEVAKECYIGWEPGHIASRYMTVTYNCTEYMKKMAPAAVHIDGTARPQVVNAQNKSLNYNFLKAIPHETREPALINTSFHRHEEPIVHHPLEGIDALSTNIVDVLVIGSFVVTKKSTTN